MKRVLLKISGESLGKAGFDVSNAGFFIENLARARKATGAQIAVVVGGGNIWRGRDSHSFGFPQAESDAVGMAATILNTAVLQRMLTQVGVKSRIFSPLSFPFLVEDHILSREIEALEAGEIVFFAGGTGSPFFTTDSAAVLRALEIGADAVLKGTKVDGVYDDDPHLNTNAIRFSELTYAEALDKNLSVMDATAFTLAMDHRIPIFVFDAFEEDALTRAITGTCRGTWIKESV